MNIKHTNILQLRVKDRFEKMLSGATKDGERELQMPLVKNQAAASVPKKKNPYIM
jgi:hypothetical protein